MSEMKKTIKSEVAEFDAEQQKMYDNLVLVINKSSASLYQRIETIVRLDELVLTLLDKGRCSNDFKRS